MKTLPEHDPSYWDGSSFFVFLCFYFFFWETNKFISKQISMHCAFLSNVLQSWKFPMASILCERPILASSQHSGLIVVRALACEAPRRGLCIFVSLSPDAGILFWAYSHPFVYKGRDDNYFRPSELYNICGNYSTLLL